MATAPAVFFDTNPTGQVISRFSKDIGVADGPLQSYLLEALASTTTILVNLSVTIVINPFNLVFTPVVALAFVLLYSYVSPLIIQLRKLELMARGPLLTTLNSGMNGLPTLRCLGLQLKFSRELEAQAQQHYRAYLTFHTMLRFSQLYADITTVMVASVNIILLVATKGYVDPAMAAYSITTTSVLLGVVANWNKSLLEASTSMASVQRLLEYSDMPNEGCLSKPDPFLITKGHLEFKEVFMRYRPELPHCLSGLTLTIHAGQKVGIVGRTGSGKSSILQVLFRLVNPETGTILIDGHDYRDMGLHDLRRQMSVIPQSAILFAVSVRENLDPFLLHTDQELIDVLEEFRLKDVILGHGQGLDAELNGEGISLSAGQRQLLCLARAVLRNNKIIMMDEATANVDNETDRIIQETVKQKFKSTLLIIAHRIKTVSESDMIIVMDKGMCREFGRPREIFNKEESIFRGILYHTGPEESQYLLNCMNKTITSSGNSKTMMIP